MAKDLNRSIKIYIDNSDAMKKAADFKARMEDVQKSLKELQDQGKQDSPEYIRKEKDLKKLSDSYGRYQQQLEETERVLKNLSGATEAELITVRSKLRQDLKKTIRDTDEYKAKLQALMAVEKELAFAQKEQSLAMGRKGSAWSSMADGFNKYFGIVTSIIAGITGVSYTLRKLAEDVAQMDDVYADVMKTTGMTRDQVVDLNETFKQMDTRTARDEINLLALDAGKLGLTSKKDILDFVEAGNQINVSLGEDLGEGAIKNIGKMTDVFALSTKELNNLDLKGKMLAIGSAINELGASSTASEAYMVNFTQRLGGVASQAGISIQNILGYASALDQSGQAVEMSATALQKFIMTLMGDPVKFAKIAGLEINSFNQLLRTDTNEAIKQVLTSLSNKGGFQALIPIFKDMGLDGARAVGVLSALATNIDKVNTAQEISNKAFTDGTSITNEYEIKNNNLQAQLEKSRKAFKDSALELGERLSPALLTSTKYTTYLIKLLPSVIDLFVKYGKYLLYVATVGTAYVAGMKLQALWNNRLSVALSLTNIQLKLKNTWLIITEARTQIYAMTVAILSGRLQDARKAFIAFNAVLKTNSVGLVIAVVAALVGAIYLMTQRTKEVITTAQRLRNVTNEATQSIAAEKSELHLLIGVARNEKISKEERLKAIKRLNEISPEYLGNLNLENINTKAATQSIESYTEALLKNAQAKAIQSKLEDISRKKMENEEKIKTEKESIAKKEKEKDQYTDESIRYTLEDIDASKKRIEQLQKENEELDKTTKTYTSFYEETLDKKNKGSLGIDQQLDVSKKSLDKLEQSFANLNAEIDKNKQNPYYTTFQQKADENRLKLLGDQVQAQRQLYTEKEKDYTLSKKNAEFMLMSQAELQKLMSSDNEYAGLASNIYKQRFSDTDNSPTSPTSTGGAGSAKKEFDLLMEELETKHQERLFAIKLKYRNGDISSESEYNRELFAQEQAYSLLKEQKLEEYRDKVLDKSDISKQLATLKTKRLDDEIAFRDKLKKIILDANPEAKELIEYENRLRDAKVFGTSKEALLLEASVAETEEEKQLLLQKHSVLELLEKQHQENLRKIKKDGIAKKNEDSEAYFMNGDGTDQNPGFQKRKEQLQQEIADEEQRLSLLNGIGALSPNEAFNSEVALQQRRIALYEEEVAARQKAGVDYSKVLQKQRSEELNMTQLYVNEYNKRRQQYEQYATSIGATIGDVISGQENALASLRDTMIDMAFDMLTQLISTEIAKLTIVGTAESAAGAAKEMGSKGIFGIGTAALISGMIMATIATAKSALKGMLGKSKSSSSSSSSGSTSSGQITVKQRAKGKYDVVGQDDGKLYKNLNYHGVAQTGVVEKPVLVGEQGSELIVSAPDFMALRKHVNYPLIVQAIQESRNGKVPQRKDGKYNNLESSQSFSSEEVFNPEILQKLTNAIDSFNKKELTTYLGITELQAKLDSKNKEDNRFKRK